MTLRPFNIDHWLVIAGIWSAHPPSLNMILGLWVKTSSILAAANKVFGVVHMRQITPENDGFRGKCNVKIRFLTQERYIIARNRVFDILCRNPCGCVGCERS